VSCRILLPTWIPHCARGASRRALSSVCRLPRNFDGLATHKETPTGSHGERPWTVRVNAYRSGRAARSAARPVRYNGELLLRRLMNVACWPAWRALLARNGALRGGTWPENPTYLLRRSDQTGAKGYVGFFFYCFLGCLVLPSGWAKMRGRGEGTILLYSAPL